MCIYIYIHDNSMNIHTAGMIIYIYNYIYRYIYVPAYTCILGRFIVLYLYSFGSLSRLVNGVVHCNFLSIFYTYIHVIEDRTVFSYYNSESLLLYPSGVTLCMWCAYIYMGVDQNTTAWEGYNRRSTANQSRPQRWQSRRDFVLSNVMCIENKNK